MISESSTVKIFIYFKSFGLEQVADAFKDELFMFIVTQPHTNGDSVYISFLEDSYTRINIFHRTMVD